MTPELVERGDRLIVRASYNPEWKSWAYLHGARLDWISGDWVFDKDQRPTVEEALARIFGEDEV